MKFKDYLKELNYYKILKHLTIGVDVLFVFLLLFNYLNYLPEFWNITYIFFAIVVINTIFLAFKIKQIPEVVRDKSSMIYYFSHFFLLSLVVIALNQFLKRQFIIDFMPEITALTIGLGFLTFYAYRNKVEKEIEDEKVNEKKKEKKRFDEFGKKFPFWNRIPVLRRFVRWMYKEGWIYVLLLILILVIFTVIKAPYFDYSFAGEHPMKYNSYVEPAKYMAEQNNPFWNQKKYLANPISNPQGIFSTFGKPPIMEWGLFLTYKIFPFNSLEFNTRLFTNFIGILILISAYIFLKFYFTKIQSLIIVFLMAINPIISIATFSTVLDSILILFMFLSLIFLSKYLNNKNIKYLFLAGLFFGIGSSIKYSLFLWLAPISLLLMFFKKRNISLFFRDYFIYILLAILPILTVKTSIKYLPSNAFLGIFLFLFWIIFYFILFLLLKKYDNKSGILAENILKHKLILIFVVLLIFIFGLIFLKFTGIISLSNEFLTDSKLILNYPMYKYMLLDQFKVYMTPIVFLMGLIGLGSIFVIRNKNIRKISISFLIGSLIYWILSSKSMFFHNYYTLVIMILFSILSSMVIFIMIKAKNKFYGIMVLFLFLLIILPNSYQDNIDRLSKEKEGFLEAAKYLEEHTNISNFYIDDSHVSLLSLETNRGRLRSFTLLGNLQFKNNIKKLGFKEAMHKYNIKYLITTKKEPKYEEFVNLFTYERLQSTSYRRTDLILDKIDKNYEYFLDIDRRKELIEEYDIKNKFKLEKQIGDYRFFIFQN